MPHAVVIGEALVDLLEGECGAETVYRPRMGGGPLNVAVGLARLGARVDFLGSLSSDALGRRIRDTLREAGVGFGGCVDVDVPTTLALTSFRGNEPDFHFYGQPPSYALFGPEHLDHVRLASAKTLYCGSIALRHGRTLAAARAAWAVPGPLRMLDPNVRPDVLGADTDLRAVVEEFAPSADVVKLSVPDAAALFGDEPEQAAQSLLRMGARTVVVTMGSQGAIVATKQWRGRVAASPVRAVDTTGAGDAVMAGLTFGLLVRGVPEDQEGWQSLVAFATTVGSLACEVSGGSTAMPTLAQVHARFPSRAAWLTG